MFKITYILTFLLVYPTFAQKDYKGKIVDAKTGLPIPYVNIGIVERSIGTVSDEEGLFHLTIKNQGIQPDDVLLFSALGYRSIQKSVSTIEMVFNEYPTLKMVPSDIELEEVVVSDKASFMIPETIGYTNMGEEAYGYWKDNIALGGELGTRIITKNGLRCLERFMFEVWHNPSDSLLLRVNVYDDDGKMGRPGTNLNTSEQNILYILKQDEHMVYIDLKPYDIYVENDFIIALELLKVYGDAELGLVLAAVKDFTKDNMYPKTRGRIEVADDGYGSYRKYASQGKWEYLSDSNMAFMVESSRLVTEKEYDRFQKRNTKAKNRNRFVSGFTISKGKMVAGATIFNHRTKERVETDKNGRYRIIANRGDILSCTKKGYRAIKFKLEDSYTLNLKLKRE